MGFKIGDICLCRNAKEMENLKQYAIKNNVPGAHEINSEDFDDWPDIEWLGYLQQSRNFKGEREITPDQFRASCDNWRQIKR
jgi:hypothetical protein